MRGSWMMLCAMWVVPMAQAASADEIPEELQTGLATLIGDAPVEREPDPEIRLGVRLLMLAQHTAVAAANLRAERGAWPTALADLGEVAGYHFDTTRYCAWRATVSEAARLEFTVEARDEAGRCGPTVQAQLSAIDAAAGEWRYEILRGPAVGTPGSASAQVIEIVQASLTGGTVRSGKQAPKIEVYEVAVPRKL
jgi:hypothetical protein